MKLGRSQGRFVPALLAIAALLSGCGDSSSASSGAEALPEFCAEVSASLPAPPDWRPSYRISAEVDLGRGVVRGDLAVAFTPDAETDRLVFRLWPNDPNLRAAGAGLAVSAVRLAGKPARTGLPDPTTLVIPLPDPLAAGETIEADLHFRLALPGPARDRISRRGDSLRLGSFFPILAWQPGAGWALDPPSKSVAETQTSPVADFDVTLAAPAGLEVLATGELGEDGHWRAEAVRDFAAAVGDFELARTTVALPHEVTVTAGVARGVEVDAVELADRASELLERLSLDYGAYPWPSYSVAVVPDLENAGIEYPTIAFQGEGPALAEITAHEVAHQWFYGLVGSNQAHDPWLDEAAATWAGARATGELATIMSTPVPDAAGRHLGADMSYWERWSLEVYTAGVYVQGAQALGGLGSERGVRCVLRRYVERNAYAVATPADMLDAASDVYRDARYRFEQYGIS